MRSHQRGTGLIIALVREVSHSLASCELTYLDRQPMDISLAQTQHLRYQQALAELGCRVVSLPAEHDLPDSVFVEDTAVVLDELSVITRPGADSRKPETASIAVRLAPYRHLSHISAPGSLDGGDVLRYGKKVFIGRSGRSNEAGIKQLTAFLGPHGYESKGIDVEGCLHLKSAVTQVSDDTLLINSNWVAADNFTGMKLINVDATEPMGANALLIGDTVIYPSHFPQTRQRLEAAGIMVRAVDISELVKAEGAVTCCSLVFEVAS